MNPVHKKNIVPSFLLFLALSLLFLLLDQLGIFSPIRSGVEFLLVPAKQRVYEIKQNNSSPRLDQLIIEEKDRKIATLSSQVTILKAENFSMRRLLGTPLPPNWRFTSALVIGRVSSEFIEIDKGIKDGLGEGMVVVVDSTLIGRVTNLGGHFSKVLLPTAENSKILAVSRKLVSKDTPESPKDTLEKTIQAKGLLTGQGGRMNFEKVTLKEVLESGDLLVTAGDEVFPPNLLLGKIGKVSRREGDIYQKAEVEPLIDASSLETVFVITGE
ncbi:MAG: rod shape-determining protein MreC [bacterium]|nr:rod shape-determining protein MreC [bacterium]